jgi:hypothetical protein
MKKEEGNLKNGTRPDLKVIFFNMYIVLDISYFPFFLANYK